MVAQSGCIGTVVRIPLARNVIVDEIKLAVEKQ
jgi:hypothetical protein